MKWKTKGPSIDYSIKNVSAYAFQYDKLNRLKLANYGSGANGSAWDEQPGAYNEALTYDGMGNIQTLQRTSSGGLMDNLAYNYSSNSNKLLSVTDNSSDAGGFNDVNKSGDDYAYDVNGNLTQDKNKGLDINYNYLNLPKSVNSVSQGKTIDYIYDATGKKLVKKFPGQADHYYMDGIEYEGSTLLFAMTEEGRVRKASDGSYTYDYFLKDHLGNIRVVLSTDGTKNFSVYPAASMEATMSATENTYYSNLDKVRNFTPVGFTSLKKNEKVAHLKGTDPNKQIGPSITVKVNSGDKVSLTAQSFYPDNTGTQRTGLAETALSQLVNAMINPAGLNANGKAIATERLKAQGFEKDAGYRDMMNKLPNSDYANENDRPKAYMVWMLFDNEMKLVKTGKSSGARQIPEGAGQVKQMAENEIVMDQGGFLTAYTVNESPASVYIDNFQLSLVTGNILEENDYYPFGMLNTGLSSPGINDPLNNYKYNGKELQKELSLEWLDYGARFYDPQIGRWHSLEPMAERYTSVSGYCTFANNPINVIDPDGKDVIVLVWATANGNFGHSAIGISNYKEVSERAMMNGKWTNQTKMVADGTYSFYELGPGEGAKLGLGNYDKDVNGDYGKDGNVSRNELINNMKDGEQLSKYEQNQADGILEINTGYANDTKAKTTLDNIKNDNPAYNGVSNNCTVNVVTGVSIATGQPVAATETIKTNNTKVTTVTPNHLYRAAKYLPNTKVVKDPGALIYKGFIEGKTNGIIKQSYVEQYY